jgi:hypothetical protein
MPENINRPYTGNINAPLRLPQNNINRQQLSISPEQCLII